MRLDKQVLRAMQFVDKRYITQDIYYKIDKVYRILETDKTIRQFENCINEMSSLVLFADGSTNIITDRGITRLHNKTKDILKGCHILMIPYAYI